MKERKENNLHIGGFSQSTDIMDILEFIKENRIPHKYLAEKLNMGLPYFKKKFAEKQGVRFNEQEKSKLILVVEEYLEGLNKDFKEKFKNS